MNALHRCCLVVALLLCATPLTALEKGVLEEIRSTLRTQALSPPDEHLLAALETTGVESGLRRIDPWAELIEDGRGGGASPANMAAGVGAQLFMQDGKLWLAPYAGGALMREGVIDRVELRSVAGVTVMGLPARAVAELLQGIPGQELSIGICGAVCGRERTVTLVLNPSRPQSVEMLTVAERYLLRLRGFRTRETRIFLESLLARPEIVAVSPLLIDLRECQGGDLYEAIDTAALFIPAGELMATALDRSGVRQRFVSPTSPKYANPLDLLIGPDTASACEVFAGTLQALGRARLLGQGTRGKCVSQTEKRLSDGSLLLYTNLEVVLTESLRCDGVGLRPDVSVGSKSMLCTPSLIRYLYSTNLRPGW